MFEGLLLSNRYSAKNSDKIFVRFTLKDGTVQRVYYPKDEPVTITYDDGTSEVITLEQFKNGMQTGVING